MKQYLNIKITMIRFIIVGFILFEMVSCTREAKKKEDGSIIKFEKTVHDFENIKMNSSKNTEFKFLNNRNSPLVINNVVTSCSCTKAEWNRDTLHTKQTGIIKISYTPNAIGPFVSVIDVYYNGKNSPQKILIKGDVSYPDKEENISVK